jgi:hypothetical protein
MNNFGFQFPSFFETFCILKYLNYKKTSLIHTRFKNFSEVMKPPFQNYFMLIQ